MSLKRLELPTPRATFSEEERLCPLFMFMRDSREPRTIPAGFTTGCYMMGSTGSFWGVVWWNLGVVWFGWAKMLGGLGWAGWVKISTVELHVSQILTVCNLYYYKVLQNTVYIVYIYCIFPCYGTVQTVTYGRHVTLIVHPEYSDKVR